MLHPQCMFLDSAKPSLSARFASLGRHWHRSGSAEGSIEALIATIPRFFWTIDPKPPNSLPTLLLRNLETSVSLITGAFDSVSRFSRCRSVLMSLPRHVRDGSQRTAGTRQMIFGLDGRCRFGGKHSIPTLSCSHSARFCARYLLERCSGPGGIANRVVKVQIEAATPVGIMLIPHDCFGFPLMRTNTGSGLRQFLLRRRANSASTRT